MGSEQTRHGHGHIECSISLFCLSLQEICRQTSCPVVETQFKFTFFHKTGITLLAQDPVKVQAGSCGA